MTRDTQHGTILVVDDDRDIRGFARLLLELAGYTVVTATDGEEGLLLYEEHRPKIGLLLTDVVMPNRSGFELADRVLKIDSDLPVLFMSGNDWSAYRGLECLTKPFLASDLIERVGRALDSHAHSAKTASAA